MNILGLSFDYHDAAAALVIDGEIIAAAQEERFTRVKHDAGLPEKAIEFCCGQAGLKPNQLDAVVFYEDPMVKMDRILRSTLTSNGVDHDFLNRTLQGWIQSDRLGFRERIAEKLCIDKSKIFTITHHQAHSASAFFCSPFPEATVITLDGVGEWETLTVSVGRGRVIEKQYAIRFPDSLGLLYSAVTAFLGFEVNEGEYKVMGMAAFGEPIHADKVRGLIHLTDDGTFILDQSFFNFKLPGLFPFSEKFVELFGKPRDPESLFEVDDGEEQCSTQEVREISRHYANIAASVQMVTEEIVLHVVSKAIQRTGINKVAMAGGVALNSLANGKLLRQLDVDLYIQPAAGDSGGALGAALWYANASGLTPETRSCLASVYLGKAWSCAEVEATLRTSRITYHKFTDIAAMIDVVADLLAKNAVIGWMQGRFEWGPRSLGARSILASPIHARMKRIVNEKIKFREPFRPFAPAVLESVAHEYFDLKSGRPAHAPENFMLAVALVLSKQASRIPAVTHVDGTARVQLVRPEISPRFHALLSAFGEKTGVPVLMNTSFNLRGEPIVSSPFDALRTFSWSGMDYLVLEDCLVSKKDSSWL